MKGVQRHIHRAGTHGVSTRSNGERKVQIVWQQVCNVSGKGPTATKPGNAAAGSIPALTTKAYFFPVNLICSAEPFVRTALHNRRRTTCMVGTEQGRNSYLQRVRLPPSSRVQLIKTLFINPLTIYVIMGGCSATIGIVLHKIKH